MPDRDVNIVLRARDQATGVFASVNRGLSRLSDSAREFGRSQQALNAAGKVFAVGESLRAGLTSVTALVAMFRGENEKALDAIERMPMGIGAIAREWKELLSPILGVTQATERLKQAQAQLAQTQANGRAQQAAENSAQGLLRVAKEEAKTIAASGDPFQEAMLERDRAFAKANKDFADGLAQKNGPTVQTLEAVRMQATRNAAERFNKWFAEWDKATLAEAKAASLRTFRDVLDTGIPLLPSLKIAQEGGRGVLRDRPSVLAERAQRDNPHPDLVAREASLLRTSPGGNTRADELASAAKQQVKQTEEQTRTLRDILRTLRDMGTSGGTLTAAPGI